MKEICLILALLCGGIAYAEPPKPHAPEAAIQIAELPQDAGKCYLSVYGHGPRFDAVSRWFNSHPDLRRWRNACHFHCVDTTSVVYKTRYAPNAMLPGKVVIRMQRPSGHVIYQAVDGDIPASDAEFVRTVDLCIGRRCKPKDEPAPKTDPEPGPVEAEEVVEPASARIPWGVIIALSLVAGLGGLAIAWRKTYNS